MDFGTIGTTVLGIIIMIVGVLIFGAIAGVAFWYYKREKKYSEYKCIIWRLDGFGQISQTIDSAGVFIDKQTQNKRLYLKKNKVGLDADRVPFVPEKSKKVVFLLQTGLKNFHYIKPNVSPPNVTLSVGEEDVNWAANSYERAKKRFLMDQIMQYLPFISLGVVSIIILIIFIYFFKQFGVLKELGASLKETAQILAQAKVGTVVMPS